MSTPPTPAPSTINVTLATQQINVKLDNPAEIAERIAEKFVPADSRSTWRRHLAGVGAFLANPFLLLIVGSGATLGIGTLLTNSHEASVRQRDSIVKAMDLMRTAADDQLAGFEDYAIRTRHLVDLMRDTSFGGKVSSEEDFKRTLLQKLKSDYDDSVAKWQAKNAVDMSQLQQLGPAGLSRSGQAIIDYDRSISLATEELDACIQREFLVKMKLSKDRLPTCGPNNSLAKDALSTATRLATLTNCVTEFSYAVRPDPQKDFEPIKTHIDFFTQRMETVKDDPCKPKTLTGKP